MSGMQSLVCIRCPRGCVIEVESMADGSHVARGYACGRGREYAIAEATHPERLVTMSIPIHGSLEPLSVKTTAPVPKQRVMEVAKEISRLQLSAPVHLHDVVLPDVCGLGVDIIATKSILPTCPPHAD
ncbi:MAG: DUF1667 domain-containing protein [Collinsella sp.]|nr:DUF1667 domain-containing protein [Collinsella sp.]